MSCLEKMTMLVHVQLFCVLNSLNRKERKSTVGIVETRNTDAKMTLKVY